MLSNNTGLIDSLKTAFNEVILPNGMEVMMPKNMQDTSLQYQVLYAQGYEMFQRDLECITEPTTEIIHLLKENMENIIQASALTLRGLKRFAKEHKEYLDGQSERKGAVGKWHFLDLFPCQPLYFRAQKTPGRTLGTALFF